MFLGRGRAFCGYQIIRRRIVRERLHVSIMMMVAVGRIGIIMMMFVRSRDDRNCTVMAGAARCLHGRGKPLYGQRSYQ